MKPIRTIAAICLAGISLTSCTGLGDNRVEQSGQATSESKDEDASIIVTGTRVARGDYENSTPVSSRGVQSQSFAPPPPPPPASMARVAASPIVTSAPRTYEPPLPAYYQDQGRDKFTQIDQNTFKTVSAEPVSTFSIDVDTASYSFIRASLNRNVLPSRMR